MRKKLAVLIAVITAAMMLFGCGGKDMSGSEYLGKWKATKAEYAGIEVGVETTGKWDETENGISIEDEMEFQKLDDNTLTYEVSGVTVHFARD